MNAMLRLVGWVLALALVVLPIVAVLNGWVGASQWPLTKLRVTGQFERVDGALLQKTLLPYAQHGFFAVDLAAAQDAVSKLPWVERAEVRKRWPDVLEVTVSEHRPFARWGDDLLLSQQGKLFPAKGIQVPKGLPQFGGPESRVSEVVELYNQSRELFAPIGLDVRDVELDPRGSWTLGLDNGARIVVGRNEARARLGRFVRLLPQLLAQQAQMLQRADLRYTNGFALTWAPMPAPVAVPQQQGQS
ncbi:cell division protein FtsQ/DivIB [Lysobacter sp. LF1]|uniref:Cell division protein FtsQ n=1 Tax=Lysobacter stagni TaxID=3045172 RepID=A0ABT6XFI2_9GAMM|nr:cell division protein FtsQ/DivIB [Lysobacter sp. LF1]MDI9238816.1 cell division protein FtsQ/DivIB [Lysobacter sp. LF1]